MGPGLGPVAVAIMAKAPRVGEVKTRLCPPLSLSDAAELYRRFLLDKIEQVKALRAASPALAYTPAEASAFFGEVAQGFILVPQRGTDLGDRLATGVGERLSRGRRGAVAVDSGTPALPLGFLPRGASAGRHRLPARHGGPCPRARRGCSRRSRGARV